MTAAPAAFPPVLSLKGVGPALAAKLQRLGVMDVRDLVLLAPLRYEDRSKITPIASANCGKHLIEGEVVLTDITGRSRPLLVCRLRDASGTLDLRFFHFNASMRNRLLPGTRWRCFGEVKVSSFGKEMIHPQMERADTSLPGIVPIYPTVAGMTQKVLRRLIGQALAWFESRPEWLPSLPDSMAPESTWEALHFLHQPPLETEVAALNAGNHPILKRLAWEELLAHHLSLQSLHDFRKAGQGPKMDASSPLIDKFLASLPFRLTDAQRRVFAEIRSDLASGLPMGRLVQGDVGCGKTVVAALAALVSHGSGYQSVLMAPTELLAEQHFQTWRQWLSPLGIKVHLLTSKMKGKERSEVLAAMKAPSQAIFIGTHALFQREVRFARLGLVMVDEQHRFGVDQRLALKAKGEQAIPHYLVMTATPIPRTLAMLRYGDMAVSVIDQLPPGRQPVETRVMGQDKREELIARLQSWIEGGRQAYWVCTLIEESQALDCEAAQATAASLQESLPGVRIGLVHGRMKAMDKEQVMNAFKQGEIDLLVATTVIEVGVDVPNAGLMVIDNAERLGLAQLHQLRGRVGRGPGQSYCILLYKPPLTEIARQRLDFLRQCRDGFALAEKDLELRGPGEVLGTRQSGALQFKMADPLRDQDLLPMIQEDAIAVREQGAECIYRLLKFWLGDGNQYADV